ncbi:MAG TPA: hypothetical protein VFP83_05450 [Candidatus Limnocylindria bacterium]|nr:hypothetical protein [Candidatus Limnocylindria bacterium]
MGWDPDSFGPQISRVQVELYTPGYRVRGEMATRFRRVADILNLTGSTHLNVEQATVVEYSESGTATHSGSTVMVAVEAVLFGISTGVDDSANPDLVVQKRPVRIDIALHPFWLTGTVHVPYGSQATDVLNVADPYLALTDVAIASAAFPGFNRNAPVLAVQRKVAEMLVVGDDADPGSALEELIPEEEARSWMPPEVES